MGPEATRLTLSKSIFLVSVGGNDLFDYNQTTSGLSKEDYLLTLQLSLRNHLQVSMN